MDEGLQQHVQNAISAVLGSRKALKIQCASPPQTRLGQTLNVIMVSFLHSRFFDKGMEGRSVDFLYTICRYIATIHTDIVEKLTRSVEIVSQKNGHYFLNQHYLYKDRLYLLVRQDLLK